MSKDAVRNVIPCQPAHCGAQPSYSSAEARPITAGRSVECARVPRRSQIAIEAKELRSRSSGSNRTAAKKDLAKAVMAKLTRNEHLTRPGDSRYTPERV